jgi:hypothetical protein
MTAPTPSVVADTPELAHGETAVNPRPVPKTRRIRAVAAALPYVASMGNYRTGALSGTLTWVRRRAAERERRDGPAAVRSHRKEGRWPSGAGRLRLRRGPRRPGSYCRHRPADVCRAARRRLAGSPAPRLGEAGHDLVDCGCTGSARPGRSAFAAACLISVGAHAASSPFGITTPDSSGNYFGGPLGPIFAWVAVHQASFYRALTCPDSHADRLRHRLRPLGRGRVEHRRDSFSRL